MSDMATGLLGIGVIAGAVGLVAIGGRDSTANEHDVSDYWQAGTFGPVDAATLDVADALDLVGPAPAEHPMADMVLPPARRDWPLVNAARWDVRGTVLWEPPYADLELARVLRRWGTDPADIAARMLREIAAEQRALAGVR
ncbi:hypothetical protein AB0C02_27905 [Micromonospora sp. NPDC048999]|uniref:hypothetical protein n=1 Tax=Micromonospora sp. NPDC048999 TaxID=3155391 RepID=UPI0034091F6F